MSGSACFSACLRSFSASRSSSRVLNLSVSAFFVLMGFGGSCGACGGVSRACGRSCGLSAGSGLEGACGAPEGRWRRLTAVRMPCAWSESRPIMALSASRSRFRAWMRRFSSHRSPLPPRFSISRLAYPSWMVGMRSMPRALKLRWSMTAYPGSRALQESAHSRLSLSRNSLESKGLLLTLTRFQTLRFLAPIFCRPVSGSMTGMRRPLASNANSLRLFAAHLPVFGSMRRLATRMCAWGLRPSLSVWMAYVQA
ncbi:Uncharacterised protein [Bifidobacterium breve]|uniref:Uncharacterized protein n=1 Tax=Bifidobacterium breve TaxID=1685 RepID=A0A6N2QU83_BIFBR